MPTPRHAAPLSLAAGCAVAIGFYLTGFPADWRGFLWNVALVVVVVVTVAGLLTDRAVVVAVGLLTLGAMLYTAMQ